VKPLHLNLADRPYRDYRPLYAAVVVTSILIALMLLNNIETGYRYVRETRTTRGKIAQIESQIDAENQRTEAASQRLRGVNVKQLSEQAQFVNARLAERAFSWSELLDRLERVLPDDVRIESVAPGFGKGGIVHLTMQASAKTGDGMTRTIDRLNHDPHFDNPKPTGEDRTDSGYKFGIGVDYRPSIARVVE
jgi:Tfp pilus assembly protein PilN